MLGRRLDRYITAFFLWHFVVCLLAIMGLYVVIDTFFHLDDFVRHNDTLAQARAILTYHLYQIPVLIGQFLPIVVLLSAVISLARLSSGNELNATKAAGISIHRTLLPVLIATVAIGALGAADQELLVPYLEPGIVTAREHTIKDDDTYRDLFAFDEKQRISIMAQKLLNAAYGLVLHRVEIVPRQASADGARKPPPRRIRASRAIWVDRWAFLFDGALTDAQGRTSPFIAKTLLLDLQAVAFAPAPEPHAQLADGTPAHTVGAILGDHPLDLAFATCEHTTRRRMLLRAQITSVRSAERAVAPIDITVALWHDKRWLGRGQSYVQRSPEKRELIVFDGDPLPLSLAPQQLIQTRTDPSLKSAAELRRLANRIPTLRQRLLLDLYSRTALPLAGLVLLLVAIPLLFQQEGGKSTLLGVGLALFVSLSYYIVTYAFQAIGRDPDGIFGGLPWLAAWLPVLLFAIAGTLLLRRMDT